MVSRNCLHMFYFFPCFEIQKTIPHFEIEKIIKDPLKSLSFFKSCNKPVSSKDYSPFEMIEEVFELYPKFLVEGFLGSIPSHTCCNI